MAEERDPSERAPRAEAPGALSDEEGALREAHRRRLSSMPYLYHAERERRRPHLAWIFEWQEEVQAQLARFEDVRFGAGCFVAPEARLIAEPTRGIEIGDECSVAADVFVHGPVVLGARVSLNLGVHIDGGRAGVRVGEDCRIGPGAKIFAFEHGVAPTALVREQPVRSWGVIVGRDVWIGAQAVITDGVEIGDHAIVGAGAVVTRSVEPWAVVGGVPARVLGDRRTWK